MDLRGKPLNPNKRLKEEFVSNLTGTSMLEIAALTAIVPALIVIRQWISFTRVNGHLNAKEAVVKKNDNATSCTKDRRSHTVALAMDYLCVVVPILLVFTVLAEWAYTCTSLVGLLLLFLILARRHRSDFHFNDGSQRLSSFRTYISSYRVSVMLVTCLCILAVDFKIFPRRYAKTETYGTGLMDVGVGLFVVTNSLVSKQARNAMSMNWKAAFQSISPLVLLGFGRLIFTTGADYQVHVGEYGVHWNFFFTLAAVTVLTSISNIHPKYCGIFGLLILTAYQICLRHGLSTYLISNERTADIISQNKEGLFSVFGYWGMYLIGVHLGYKIFFGNHSSSTVGYTQQTRVTVWTLFALFWFLTVILDNYVERVSRRTCNLAYVMIVFAQTFQVLSILMLSDFTYVQKPLVLEEAFNQNMLGTFLLANVLTGMVNLSVDTLSASSIAAIGILLGYSSILTAVVGLACFYGIKLKFW
ncbi:uncharacterized protein At4g17910 isoform X2 [Phoenix dactylifera]|uniref:Uncharacterized protein At4g17910 isoform X2 n=1 Tax=Phoenix dactylifera TaxID=42345 RepID=A0A8B7BLD2_PHODC|nr:uncharacterized protein At4g17910 isoform X2 [Phoenix dactylifera]